MFLSVFVVMQCGGVSGAGAGGGLAPGGGMLAALVAEAGGSAPVVFSDELGGSDEHAPAPHAPHVRHVLDDDNSHTACLSNSPSLCLFYLYQSRTDKDDECHLSRYYFFLEKKFYRKLHY